VSQQCHNSVTTDLGSLRQPTVALEKGHLRNPRLCHLYGVSKASAWCQYGITVTDTVTVIITITITITVTVAIHLLLEYGGAGDGGMQPILQSNSYDATE
jgi:hypothetical protein